MIKKRTLLIPLVLLSILTACGTVEENTQKEKEPETDEVIDTAMITLNTAETYQTIESFGASGAWWSQDVGGWIEEETAELSKREYIAELLFDPLEGIGLTSYRYNLGAGSTLQNSPRIEDSWRRAENFEE